MFRKAFPIEDIMIIAMPGLDIEEVVYDRQVGWGIRELRLDSKTEDISATKIREELK